MTSQLRLSKMVWGWRTGWGMCGLKSNSGYRSLKDVVLVTHPVRKEIYL